MWISSLAPLPIMWAPRRRSEPASKISFSIPPVSPMICPRGFMS